MSSDHYQRSVNSLDKDIADLEKKKAAADKKAADEQGKAARVRFSSNISMSSLKVWFSTDNMHFLIYGSTPYTGIPTVTLYL